jgi:hypothetical protein
MQSLLHTVIRSVVLIGAGMIILVVLHIGGNFAHVVGQFSPLIGAFIGGSLTLFSACLPRNKREKTQPWLGFEQLSWLLIGLGVTMWGIGETFWRYYISIGQTPFPSLADIGYSAFPPLAFTGLLLLPSPNMKSRRFILLMDSLISMGSIFALSWYLLLGSLAQAPGEANLAKFLGMYYPVSDTALLSCVVFLLLRGQGNVYQVRARRISLLVLGLGLCFFVSSDFIFNIQQNASTYVEATWIDLGWPLGMMTIGMAACLRRFLPVTPKPMVQPQQERRSQEMSLGPLAFIPYFLLGLLFVALAFDIFSTDMGQVTVRPVLLFATLGVVALVIVRQIYTLQENMLLTQQQAEALEDLEQANRRVEEQARQIAEHNVELERGIAHLQNVQASLANGNLQARAQLTKGALMSLGGSLNIMAERLMRQGEATAYAKRLTKALNDLSMVFERAAATGACIVIPESCSNLIEIHRLLTALRIKRMPSTSLTGQPFPATPADRWTMQSVQPVNPATPAPPTPVRRPFTTGPLTQREAGEMNTRRHPDLQHLGARPLRTVHLAQPQQAAAFSALRTEPLGGKGE